MSRFASFIGSNEASPSSTIDCTYVIRDATEALNHARGLLAMLVDVSIAAAAAYDATPAFHDYIGWLLDSFLAAHELHKKWQTNPSLHPICSDACLLPFCSVHTILTSLRDSVSPSLLRKAYNLLSTLCADLLEDPAQLSKTSVRLNLCSSIMNLAAGCQKYDSVRRAVSLHLLPVVQANLTAGNTITSGMGNNFKVDKHCPLSNMSCLLNYNLDSMHSSLSGVPSRSSQRNRPQYSPSLGRCKFEFRISIFGP